MYNKEYCNGRLKDLSNLDGKPFCFEILDHCYLVKSAEEVQNLCLRFIKQNFVFFEDVFSFDKVEPLDPDINKIMLFKNKKLQEYCKEEIERHKNQTEKKKNSDILLYELYKVSLENSYFIMLNGTNFNENFKDYLSIGFKFFNDQKFLPEIQY